MDEQQLAPTPEIIQAVSVLDEAIRAFLDARDTIPTFGMYESYDEAMLLLGLIIRNVEAVMTLATRDLILLPAAHIVTRAAYEIAFRVLWLLEPDDPYQSEARWMALARERERYYSRLDERRPPEQRRHVVTLARLKDFHDAVEAKLHEIHYAPVLRIPTVEQMVEQLGTASRQGGYSHISWRRSLHTVARLQPRYIVVILERPRNARNTPHLQIGSHASRRPGSACGLQLSDSSYE